MYNQLGDTQGLSEKNKEKTNYTNLLRRSGSHCFDVLFQVPNSLGQTLSDVPSHSFIWSTIRKNTVVHTNPESIPTKISPSMVG
jgi:hypothetical protein